VFGIIIVYPDSYSGNLCLYARKEDAMAGQTLRLPDELHEKIRWLAYKEHRSQHAIIIDILKKSLAKVKVPKEGK